jgi:uncharacterized protein YndB with AHSA1/START domain
MYGELDHVDGRPTLRFTRRLAHPPEKVWRALTEPEHLAVWFPSSIEGERKEGAALQFVFPHGEGPTIEGEMITYDPPSVLEYRWGDEVLRFTLEPADGGTHLTFVNTFDDIGKAARDAAGWHACLDALEYDVDGDKPPWSPEQRWAQVHPHYVEHLPPEASTIGPPNQ